MMRSTNGAVLELLPHGRPPVQGVEQEAAPHLEQPAGHDVVEHAHALEEGHVLERARDAERGDLVGAKARAVPALVEDAALGGVVEAADTFSSVVLPAPLGPMIATISPRADVEADRGQRLHGAEADADALDREERAEAARGRHAVATANGSASRIAHVGADGAGAAVLVGHLRLDLDDVAARSRARRSAPRTSRR